MALQNEILVITTTLDNEIKIKKYLKPVSAHVVAGTNIFSDFLGSITDVFGGRSISYQKQLASLYDEAIEVLKNKTFEIGGNCVIGLKVDMDEISGKGKSMFMITAVGTAVLIDENIWLKNSPIKDEKLENLSYERLKTLQLKNEIISSAKNKELNYDDSTWDFIITYQIDEIFDEIIEKYKINIEYPEANPDVYNIFNKQLTKYISNFEYSKKINLLYNKIEIEENNKIAKFLAKKIEILNLFNFDKIFSLLNNENFRKKKIGLLISTFHKEFYNKKDVEDLKKIIEFITKNFNERGIRSMKKQLLSTKEKEIWNCECGNNNNEINEYCTKCNNNIYGFWESEKKPIEVIEILEQKIKIINQNIMN